MKKYIFMGTPDFAAAILQTLCENLYPPVAVVTQEAKAVGRGHKVVPTPVEQYARSQDLTVFATGNVNAPMTIGALKIFHPELVLVAAFGQILKNDVLTLPSIACLNVHGSLLPKYRGAAPVQRAIMNGDKETGITIQKMAKKLDTGDILLMAKTPIDPEENSLELMNRLSTLGGECLIEAVKKIDFGNYTFTPQVEADATYAPKLEKEEAKLDWNKPAEVLKCQIRGLNPWPVAQTLLGGEPLKVFRSEVASSPVGKPIGSIESDGKTYLRVQCGSQTALSLLEVQALNRKRLEIRQFLAGLRGNIPVSFG